MRASAVSETFLRRLAVMVMKEERCLKTKGSV
jgi:hypothetical protein